MEQDVYLIIPDNSEASKILNSIESACAKEKPQAVLYAPENHSDKDAKRIVQNFQNRQVAVIIKNDVEKTLSLQADGVQVLYRPDIKKIKQKIGDLALGVICSNRDEAMRAGETGADYIGFESENAEELLQWWCELFTLPCVDFNPDSPSKFADFRIRMLSC